MPDGVKGQKFLEYLREFCLLPHGQDVTTNAGPYETVQVSHLSNVPFSYLVSSSKLDRLLNESVFIDLLKNVLDAIQLIIPPYYVGETGDSIKNPNTF